MAAVNTIPLFELNYDEAEEQAVLNVVKSRWLSTGPKTAEFEKLFAESLHVKHAVALGNCTVALHLALRCAGIGPGDEVLCPSLTFVATANAIRYVGAEPVFCDIRSLEDLTIDPAEIAAKITPRTKAIMVMHFGGFPCDMQSIMGIAEKHNLQVLEDACHAPLTELNGKKMGTFGAIGCFSFFSNKNMGTGEGGMLVTDNDELATSARLLRSHGMTSMSYDRARGHATAYDVVDLGYNFRMDDMRAALGVEQLKKLPGDLIIRAQKRDAYLSALAGIEGMVIPFRNVSTFSSNYIFTIVLTDSTVDKRDSLREYLKEHGVQTSVHYPAVHRFAIYAGKGDSLPLTEYVADNLITLPFFARLTDSQIQYIAGLIREFLGK